MKSARFLLLLFTVIFFSCEKMPEDESAQIIEIIKDKVIGKYNVSGMHRIGIVIFYDDEYNVIGTGYDTIYYENKELEITQFMDTDTILVNLNRGHNSNVKFNRKFKAHITSGISSADYVTAEIHYNNDNYYYNDRAIGTLIIDTNLTLNYNWDTSDTYLDNALPFFGRHRATGVRIE